MAVVGDLVQPAGVAGAARRQWQWPHVGNPAALGKLSPPLLLPRHRGLSVGVTVAPACACLPGTACVAGARRACGRTGEAATEAWALSLYSRPAARDLADRGRDKPPRRFSGLPLTLVFLPSGSPHSPPAIRRASLARPSGSTHRPPAVHRPRTLRAARSGMAAGARAPRRQIQRAVGGWPRHPPPFRQGDISSGKGGG